MMPIYICCKCGKSVELKNNRRSESSPYRCTSCVNKDPERSLRVSKGLQKRSKEDWDKTNTQRRNTNIEKYGVDSPMKDDKVKEKLKNIFIEKYGVDNPSKAPEVIQRIKDVSYERYGVDNPAKAEVNRKKISEGLKNSDFDRVAHMHKQMKILQENGVELSGAVDKKKSEETCMKKYGAKTFFESDAGLITKKTLMEKYGWDEEEYEIFRESRKQNLNNFIKKYGEEQGRIKFEEYKNSVKHTEETFIKRHGEEQGRIKFKEYLEKRMRNSTYGVASKESLKFFIPIYRKIRKFGIAREDIYFGISGSREFYLGRKNEEFKFFLYDFTIRSLNIIIEYNGVFWHVKESDDISYKESIKDKDGNCNYEERIKREREKIKLAKIRGFDVYVVWSDEDLEFKKMELLRVIKEKIDGK